MLKLTNLLSVLLIVLVIICIGITSWCLIQNQKIAFVRASVLVENYLGMKEAQTKFELQSEGWRKNLDSLMLLYNQSVNYLKENRVKLTKRELMLAQEDIAKKEQNFNNYNTSIEKLSSEENERLTQGALNQINSYIEQYAKEKHIDIVIGVTLSGNVLYGADKIDITKEVLEGLNKSYK